MMTGSGNVISKRVKKHSININELPLPLMPKKPKEVLVRYTVLFIYI